MCNIKILLKIYMQHKYAHSEKSSVNICLGYQMLLAGSNYVFLGKKVFAKYKQEIQLAQLAN